MNSAEVIRRLVRREIYKQLRIQWLVILALIIALIAVAVHAAAPQAVAETEPVAMSATPVITMPTSLPDITPAPVRTSLGEFKLTAYCPCMKCCEIWSEEHPSRIGTDYIQKTRSGTIPQEGRTIAVDPDIIPLGTTVYINDHEYIAEDVGGAVTEHKIDIFFATHDEACAFGVQKAIVYIKGE